MPLEEVTSQNIMGYTALNNTKDMSHPLGHLLESKVVMQMKIQSLQLRNSLP